MLANLGMKRLEHLTNKYGNTGEIMKCSKCKKEIIASADGFIPGYAKLKNGRKICYECCANINKKSMRDTGRAILYLSEITPQKEEAERFGNWPMKCGEVMNWPGTLRFPLFVIHKGRHNLAGIRRDVYFTFENTKWHGVNYGYNSQILYCKRLKQKS